MSWRDNERYPESHEFSADHLIGITPEELVAFFNKMAFETMTPGIDDCPTGARSSTLAYYKKAISKFMPRKNLSWDVIRCEGNPTKSILVNEMIKNVKRFEVRKQGKPAQARRAFEFSEFIQILTILRNHEFTSYIKAWQAALLSIQWQLIGRVDDMMKLSTDDIFHNIEHDYTILIKVSWSKNVSDERDPVEQIIMGSFNSLLCPLLNLALFLETSWYFESDGDDSFLFRNPNDGHEVARGRLRQLYGHSNFVPKKEGLLGTHSIRKGATTYAYRCRMSRDYVESRGRWKNSTRQVNTYVDPLAQVQDAQVAEALTGVTGPCKYSFRKDIDVPSTEVLWNIARATRRRFGEELATTLALPLIWHCFEYAENRNDLPYIDRRLRSRIISLVKGALGTQEDGNLENPVIRIGYNACSYDGQLELVERHILEGGENLDEVVGGVRRDGAPDRQLGAILAEVRGIKRRQEEIYSITLGEFARVNNENKSLRRSVQRLSNQPIPYIRRSTPGNIQNNPTSTNSGPNIPVIRATEKPARLSKGVKDLYLLWREFEMGLDGHKAAKEFTPTERGKVKALYSVRKVFWDVTLKLTRRGHSYDTAIDKVYQVYGRGQPVSYILKKMRQDRQNGGHPSLQ